MQTDRHASIGRTMSVMRNSSHASCPVPSSTTAPAPVAKSVHGASGALGTPPHALVSMQASGTACSTAQQHTVERSYSAHSTSRRMASCANGQPRASAGVFVAGGCMGTTAVQRSTAPRTVNTAAAVADRPAPVQCSRQATVCLSSVASASRRVVTARWASCWLHAGAV